MRRRRGRPHLAAGVVLVLLGCVVLTGCAAPDQIGSQSHRVSTWMSGVNGGNLIGSVEADVRNVDLAVQQHDSPGQLRSLCALLASDAANGNGNLPTPDAKLTTELSDAFATAYDAGSDCYHAGNSTKQRARSSILRVRALAQLAAAVNRVAFVTGQVPSTTTTLAPPGNDPFA